MKRQSGFTLIELISVIVILGVLSAFAIPRFADVETEARTAAVNGLAGAVRSASALAHAVCLAQSCTSTTDITMENQVVQMNDAGYPVSSATGISDALADDPSNTGFVEATGTNEIRWTIQGATAPNCTVTYNDATANAPPTITATVAGC